MAILDGVRILELAGHTFVPAFQYDEAPARPARAPKFNEHGDQILGDLGLASDAIIDLKVRGIVA